jgi:maltooligosyltrehalose synthase
VPRLVVQLVEGWQAIPVGEIWRDTSLPLPEGHAGRRWRNIFTGEAHQGGTLGLAALLGGFPVALLVDEA